MMFRLSMYKMQYASRLSIVKGLQIVTNDQRSTGIWDG